jgi:hypothetical protein
MVHQMTKVTPRSNLTGDPGPSVGTVPKGSTRSGYAKDIKPELIGGSEAAGHAVPIASESGRQDGRTPPAQRKTPHYNAVSSSEAEDLMRKRMRGEEPPIVGGLDDPIGAKREISQYEDTRMEIHDKPADTGDGSVQQQVQQITGLKQLLNLLQAGPAVEALAKPANIVGVTPDCAVVERAVTPKQVHEKSATTSYLMNRARVQLQIENAGIYSIPAIDVIVAGFGIFVLLPAGDNDATFVPNPGAGVQVTFKGKSYNCYFPGVAGDIPDLRLMVLAMINKDAGGTDGEA